jgi:catechol 2,3-dioxygenase-like lactoylglutathione lyase family enzyme
MAAGPAARVSAILKVSDMPATLAWYRAAGFDIRDAFPPEEPTWCEVARDGLVLQFLAGQTPWEADPILTGSFYLYPQSVDAVYEEIGGSVECPWGIEEREWGARELVVRDPDGYLLTFSEAA